MHLARPDNSCAARSARMGVPRAAIPSGMYHLVVCLNQYLLFRSRTGAMIPCTSGAQIQGVSTTNRLHLAVYRVYHVYQLILACAWKMTFSSRSFVSLRSHDIVYLSDDLVLKLRGQAIYPQLATNRGPPTHKYELAGRGAPVNGIND